MYKTIFDKNNKLWKGHDVPPLYNPEISIAQVLLKAMKINGTKIAQVITNFLRRNFEYLKKYLSLILQNIFGPR